MNKNNQLLKLIVLSLASLSSMPVFSVQDVYEYQNKEGVTEFTDKMKANKKPEKHIQIQKMTPEQEIQSKEKLDEIMAKDEKLDKRLAKEKELEEERLEKQKKSRQEELKQQPSNSNNDNRYSAPRVTPKYKNRPRLRIGSEQDVK
ncbi:MAG: hypothetical protein KZQ83_14605 [gamma proteobacterium symbiont of Taylorina sp.]|nr:hypothetical protein [gamma proteobacterium symbiont of Taylorina sp.]